MNEHDKEIIVENDNVYTIIDYFEDHPIMLLGAGLSAVILSLCKMIDNKNNKEMK